MEGSKGSSGTSALLIDARFGCRQLGFVRKCMRPACVFSFSFFFQRQLCRFSWMCALGQLSSEFRGSVLCYVLDTVAMGRVSIVVQVCFDPCDNHESRCDRLGLVSEGSIVVEVQQCMYVVG